MFLPEFVKRAKRRAEAKHARARRAIGDLRERLAKGFLTQLDDRLSRRGGGYLKGFVEGREDIKLLRFFYVLELLRVPVADFFRTIEPEPPIPAAPVGYLPKFAEKRPSKVDLEYLDSLETWIADLRVVDSGYRFHIEADSLLKLANRDPERAFDQADSSLQLWLKIAPDEIHPESGFCLIKVLAVMGDLLRVRGFLNASLELLDLAFAVEMEVEDFATRSFLFRTGSYLLCDLGYLAEALSFAESGLKCSLASEDSEGQVTSMYVRAEMTRRWGNVGAAVPLLRATLSRLADSNIEFRAAIHVALAVSCLELARPAEAMGFLQQVLPLADQLGHVNQAKLVMLEANIVSHLGDKALADDTFERGLSLLGEATAQTAATIVVAELSVALHLLRFGDLEGAQQRVRRVNPLVNQIRGNVIGEAAVLHLLRCVARGQLQARLIEDTISRLEEPWRARTRHGAAAG